MIVHDILAVPYTIFNIKTRQSDKRKYRNVKQCDKLFLVQDARSKNIEDVLILSGDHLYRMDYMDFVQVRLKMT